MKEKIISKVKILKEELSSIPFRWFENNLEDNIENTDEFFELLKSIYSDNEIKKVEKYYCDYYVIGELTDSEIDIPDLSPDTTQPLISLLISIKSDEDIFIRFGLDTGPIHWIRVKDLKEVKNILDNYLNKESLIKSIPEETMLDEYGIDEEVLSEKYKDLKSLRLFIGSHFFSEVYDFEQYELIYSFNELIDQQPILLASHGDGLDYRGIEQLESAFETIFSKSIVRIINYPDAYGEALIVEFLYFPQKGNHQPYLFSEILSKSYLNEIPADLLPIIPPSILNEEELDSEIKNTKDLTVKLSYSLGSKAIRRESFNEDEIRELFSKNSQVMKVIAASQAAFINKPELIKEFINTIKEKDIKIYLQGLIDALSQK